MIYKTILGVSYLKTQNSTYNKLLTRTYLQTLFSINDQQLLFLTEYRCTGVLHTWKKTKKKTKKYYKIKSTGDQLNIAYDEVNFVLGI